MSVARASSGAHATTSAASARIPPAVLRTRTTAAQRRPSLQQHQRHVVTPARRRGSAEPDDTPKSSASGFQFSSRRGYYRVQLNDYEAEVKQDEAWKLLVPLLGGLVLASAVIGPLIIGVAFTAVAVGAALSAGALFTSLFLPFFLFVGMGALFFGGLTFSAFATLGTALLLPKLISLAVVAGGLGLGALSVSAFLKPAADKAKVSYKGAGKRGSEGKGVNSPQQEPEVVEEAEVVDPEVERQLREFDQLLAGREEQRRRTERTRGGGR